MAKNKEYNKYFNQLIDLDDSMIEKIMESELNGEAKGKDYILRQSAKFIPILDSHLDGFKRSPLFVETTCTAVIEKKSEEIHEIVKSHKMSSKSWADCCYDIVQLVAPVVAQMMFGIPGLAIVGGILIVCKKRYAHFFAESQPALTMESKVEKIEK